MSQDLQKDVEKRLEKAYRSMIEALKSTLEEVEEKSQPVLDKALEQVKAYATKLENITKEESERLLEYLKRDLAHFSQYVEDSSDEITQAVKTDYQLVESRFFEEMLSIADQANIQLWQLKQTWRDNEELHTGEITSLSDLVCENCGQTLHLKKASHIPPCPKCHETVFKCKG